MNDQQRLQLQKMLHGNKDAVDQTLLIRKLKHSYILKDNIQTLLELKKMYGDDTEKIQMEGMSECSFLYNYYTDIFNKVKNDEINLDMLFNFLKVLKKIEDDRVDQHEGSFEIGTILKKIYIDSTLQKSKKLDEEHKDDKDDNDVSQIKSISKDISYKDFKKKMHDIKVGI